MENTTKALVKALQNYLATPTRVAGATEDAFTRVPLDNDSTRQARELLRKLTE